jgi:NTP pyrophosphatase (non-canonical NTP hydrolase)
MTQANEIQKDLSVQLPSNANMKDYQRYIDQLEHLHGWEKVDLVHNCFLMGEEVGELFKGVRKYLKYAQEESTTDQQQSNMAQNKENIAEEIVDVFNYLLAIANRLEIDVEQAFIDKNTKNQKRTWK